MPPMTGLKRKAETGVFYARRAIPDGLRAHFAGKRELVKSLGTSDLREAQRRRDDLWTEWDAQLAEAREQAAGVGTLDEALAAVDGWRRGRCEAALTGQRAAVVGAPGLVSYRVRARPLSGAPSKQQGPLVPILNPEAAALAYFDRHPAASREASMPHSTGLLLGRLQRASREPEGWREVEGFDAVLDAALAAAEGAPALSHRSRPQLRQRFAQAWAEVVQHEEAERLRAAAFLAAFAAMRADAARIAVAAAPGGYVPREGDRTLGELVQAYRAEANSLKKYDHIFAAAQELLGKETPVRALTRADGKRVRETFRQIPANATKRFKGVSILEAVEAAKEDDEVQLLAPNSVKSYMAHIITALNWGVRQQDGWLERNPFKGLMEEDLPQVQRRGFTEGELGVIFAELSRHVEDEPWKFWIPSLALYTGARLNELCQLKTTDLQWCGDLPFLRLSEFEATGRRSKDKRLKTADSERNIPLHPALVKAGLVDYMTSRSSGRVFPEIKTGPSGNFSHYPSRWFGEVLNVLDLKDPALVFHSFRHGFRDACDAADVHPDRRKVIGGWKVTAVAERYGNRDAVPVLSREVAKLSFGRFSLPCLSTRALAA